MKTVLFYAVHLSQSSLIVMAAWPPDATPGASVSTPHPAPLCMYHNTRTLRIPKQDVHTLKKKLRAGAANAFASAAAARGASEKRRHHVQHAFCQRHCKLYAYICSDSSSL